MKLLLCHNRSGAERGHGPVGSPWEGKAEPQEHPCTPLFPGGAPAWVLLGVVPSQKPVPGRCTAAEWSRTKEL